MRWVRLLLVLALAGCASDRLPAPDAVAEAPAVADSVWRQYQAAVAAARQPTAAKISKDLLPLVRDSPRLEWRDGRVLMVTWTKSRHFPQPPYRLGYDFALYGDTWFTAVPAVRDFCRAYQGADLDLRLRQRLGLPPDDANDVFVELWIEAQDIFRPCPDPEISDSQCQVRIPLLDERPAPGAGEPPWACPRPGLAPRQLSGQFVIVHSTHLEWMCHNWKKSYLNPDPRDDYPWTALGYTYDWSGDDPRGESEYVALGGTRVIFERMVETDAYCGR